MPWRFPQSDLCDLRGKDAEGIRGVRTSPPQLLYRTIQKNQITCHKVESKVVFSQGSVTSALVMFVDHFILTVYKLIPKETVF